jgi:hypothetical protein
LARGSAGFFVAHTSIAEGLIPGRFLWDWTASLIKIAK